MKSKKNGIMVISLDFELQYGMEDVSYLSSYKKNISGARKAVPAMLNLFEEYQIHATWAVVGMMLAESKKELYSYIPSNRPMYINKALSIYEHMDRVGENEKEDPYHYALTLVECIKNTPGQEIASHTFCHYYCLEKGQTKVTFERDLESAIKIIADKVGENCKSLILPRNQINKEYLSILNKSQIQAYRGCPNYFVYTSPSKSCVVRMTRLLDAYINILGKKCYPIENILQDGVCNIKASSFLRPYHYKLRFFEGIKLKRIKAQMRHAAKKGLVYHLWWHPHNFGINTEKNFEELKEILDYYEILKEKYNFQSKTMNEVAAEVFS